MSSGSRVSSGYPQSVPTPTQETTIATDRVVFRLPDIDPAITGVQLWSEVPVARKDFERTEDGWELSIPRTGAHRIEYLFKLALGDDTVTIADPTNPLRIEGVFGENSWLPISWRGRLDRACSRASAVVSKPVRR